MKNKQFDLSTLGEDPILIENTLKIALACNFSSVMLTRADAGYAILYVNPAFSELTGYSYEEVACCGSSHFMAVGGDSTVNNIAMLAR